jgi:hypothetical protein
VSMEVEYTVMFDKQLNCFKHSNCLCGMCVANLHNSVYSTEQVDDA